LPSSPLRPAGFRFCLDANLSYRAADAVDSSIAEVIHISRVAELSVDELGRSDASDENIARWCAENEVVLVTCDDDFRGRTARTSALTKYGVEVIVFAYQICGLQNQIDTVARCVTSWQKRLEVLPYEGRVWIQHRTGGLSPDR